MGPMPLSPGDVQAHRDRVAWLMFVAAAILVATWAVLAILDWSRIAASPTLLGYLVADLLLLVPLSVASWIGLRKGQEWGSLVFLIAIGAAIFNVLQVGTFAIEQNVLPMPLPIYVIVVLAAAGLGLLANWEIAVLLNVDSYVFRLGWDQFRYVIVITGVLHGEFILFAPAAYSVPEFFIGIMVANLVILIDVYVRPVHQAPDPEPIWYKFVGLGAVAALALVPYLEHTTLNWALPAWVSWVAIIAAISSGSLMIYCRILMGNFALGTLHLIDGHQLFQENVYRHVRHPIYTSIILFGASYAMIFRAPVSAVATFVVAVLFFAERIRREDKMLADHFGDEFRQYKRTTNAFFPSLRRDPDVTKSDGMTPQEG